MMLLGDIYFKDTSVILEDVDGSTVELTAYDAWGLVRWVQENQTLMLAAIRRADAQATARAGREDEENEEG